VTAGIGSLRRSNVHSREVFMRLSARNVIKGKVKKLIHGPVSTEVVLDLPGGLVLKSVITREAADELKLAEGKEAYAIVKATSVMVGVD
jgi:molybdopterin-binding protein